VGPSNLYAAGVRIESRRRDSRGERHLETASGAERESSVGARDNGTLQLLGTAERPVVIEGLCDAVGAWVPIHLEASSRNFGARARPGAQRAGVLSTARQRARHRPEVRRLLRAGADRGPQDDGRRLTGQRRRFTADLPHHL
jgi:hypothetical protein